MTDHHVHIGQFNEIYYDPLQVLDAIETVASQTLITEVHYSSTSSCRDDVVLSKIEEEIFYTQQFRSDVLIAKPYLWFVPKYANENISAKSALQGFDYWSMKENTAHPTQKPEKLIAKLILASSNEGDVVFDPFLGSGTTSVTAKKLNRNFVGIEQNPLYCAWTEHRLFDAEKDNSIQGFSDGVFWERNSK